MLDSGPLGLITNPKLSPESMNCAQWLQTQITSGNRVIVPEIADYEIRRELLRANKTKGIARLNDLANIFMLRMQIRPLKSKLLRLNN